VVRVRFRVRAEVWVRVSGNTFKRQVQCFSMQVVMNKCFLLNTEKKKSAQIRFVVFEKNAKYAHLNSEK